MTKREQCFSHFPRSSTLAALALCFAATLSLASALPSGGAIADASAARAEAALRARPQPRTATSGGAAGLRHLLETLIAAVLLSAGSASRATLGVSSAPVLPKIWISTRAIGDFLRQNEQVTKHGK